MKTIIKLLCLIVCISLLVISCRPEETGKTEILKTLKDEPAYVIKGCFEYSRVDSISIALENYPEGIITIFPSAEIPEQYRVENLKVLISGNILDREEFNACWNAPNVRIASTHIFELTNIKNN